MREFVLLGKRQVAVNGDQAAKMVQEKGFKAAAAGYGVGDSTLRKFLKDEGFRFTRTTSWQVEELPGLELNGADRADNGAGAPPSGAAEHPGEAERPGGVEAAGV